MAENDEPAPETSGEQGSQAGVAEEFKLSMDVEVEEIGPCKKHVRVTIPRDDISHVYGDAVEELAGKAQVPGFRVGHVPRKLLQRRFRDELNDEVKQKLLMESLEQLSKEQNIDPINEPNLDLESIEVPEEGDFVYEFDVEVRPEFEVPDYKGLKVQRPAAEISEAEVDEFLQQYLAQYSEFEEREGPAEPGDHLTLSVEFRHEGRPLRKLHDLTVQIKPVLRFQDAELTGFDELMTGARPGETREADLTVSSEVESIEMRGETIHGRFTVEAVKRIKPPELDSALLNRIGVESKDELRGEIREMLERQAVYQQRQSVRRQVLDKITESADWDLPEDLVRKQVDNALRREILEMQQAGFTQQDIQARENELRQRALSTTRQSLKEHFVLDKIAEAENIEVDPQDIETEIAMMAMQRGESPRRVRARLAKSGMIENLEAQIRERKAVDSILAHAQFEEVEAKEGEEERSRVEAVGRSVLSEPAVEAGPAEEQEEEGEQAGR